MAAGSSSQRRRGVIASRARLTHALTGAGLKTQAALAERIADTEDLDSPPKDAVGRAFRELPVDLLTLERIARALGVEAHTLYRTADEQVLPASADQPETARGGRLPIGLALATLALIAAALSWPPDEEGSERVPSGGGNVAPAALGLGTPTLVVLPIEGDAGDALGSRLRERLASTFRVATGTANVIAGTLDTEDVADRLRSDAVVDGQVVRVGRLAGLRVWLYSQGARRQVWAESLPAVALERRRESLVERATVAVKRATGFPVDHDGPAPHFPLAPVQNDYLEGEYHLGRPSNELNVKRAQARFEAALRRDSNYARAHAGLCQTLLEEHWMSDEERALEDAGLACGQALQLDPDDPVVAAAHAHYLRRTGRNDEAIARYEAVVEAYPLDAAAWTGLASSLLHAYRQHGDEAILARAKTAARTAAGADPQVWKSLFALASMEYFDGDVAAAIIASEEALERDENEYVAANLGTFYLCDGRFEPAIRAYSLARELAPGSYVGDEFLGMAHYFAGDFEESAELRRRAIDSIATGEPEIHEMWGNLGDSYRQLGRRDEAVEAYLHAAEIAERDHLRGTAPAADRAARAYYYTMLGQLDTGLVPEEIEESLAAGLDDIDAALVSATAHRRMAQTWLARGEIGKARRSLARATETCRGYADLPDLAMLTEPRADLQQQRR